MKNLLQALLFVFVGSSLIAQEYNFRHFTTEHGLVQVAVNDIVQDRKGYIWIATDGGLSRFDGKSFVNYTAQDGLGSNKCLTLFNDSKGRVWISHLYGLSLIEGKKIRSFNDSNGVKIREISAFAEMDGKIWVGGNGGVLRYDNLKFEHFTIKDHERFPIKSIVADKSGVLWIGYGNGGGLVFGRDNIYKNFQGPKIFNSIGFLKQKENGISIYADDGIYFFQNNTLKQEVFNNEYWGVEDVAISPKGSQWLATANGLAVLENGLIRYLNETNGIPANEITSVLYDREGNIWAGCRKGLFLLTSRAFSHFKSNQNLPDFAPSSIVEGKDGRIWFNSEHNGLFVFNNGFITKVNTPKSLNDHYYSCLTLDSKQNVWMGTSDFNGIFQFSGNVLKQFTSDNGLCDNNIQCLITSADDNIWAGTSKGICQYDGKKWSSLGDPVGSISFDVRAMHFSENGRLWIGTADGKVYHYRNETYTILGELEGKIHSAITSISSKGEALYFSTESDGLVILSGETVSFANKSSGMYTNEFRFAAIGDKQKLYCGTSKGLLLLGLNSQNKIISQKILGITEGFTGSECLKGSVLISRSGSVWVGTPRGVTIFNPKETIINSTPPCIDISDILINHKEPDWSKYSSEISPLTGFGINPSFNYQENYALFKLKGLSFSSFSGLRYKWILDGFEKEWNPPASNNEASYPNLPAGDYTFRAKAISAAGVESAEATYSFTISPPFWQTIWFYVFILVIIVIGTLNYIRYREKRLVQEKAILELAVKERTIALEEQKTIVEQINTDILNSIEYARNIQLAILPGHDEISKSFSEHFILYKPQNIVSGDLYWYYRMENIVWAAAIDCTGHGVPGAFMSMMSNDLLNQSIIEKQISSPAEVLADINQSLRLVFKDENEVVETQQGMDISLVCINLNSGAVKFSGAMRPVIAIISNEIMEFEGDKASIGRYTDVSFPFTNFEFNINKNDTLLLFSDGYCDQFGGPKGRKLMTSRFKQTIVSNKNVSLEVLGRILESDLEAWQGEMEQLDDILVWGLRL